MTQEKIEILGAFMVDVLPKFHWTYIALEATRRHCPSAHERGFKRFKAELLDECERTITGIREHLTAEDIDHYAKFVLELLKAKYGHEHIPKSTKELEALLDRKTRPQLDALLAPLPDRSNGTR